MMLCAWGGQAPSVPKDGGCNLSTPFPVTFASEPPFTGWKMDRTFEKLVLEYQHRIFTYSSYHLGNRPNQLKYIRLLELLNFPKLSLSKKQQIISLCSGYLFEAVLVYFPRSGAHPYRI